MVQHRLCREAAPVRSVASRLETLCFTMGPSSLPGLGPISLEVRGRGCNHHRVFDVDCYPDDVPVPSFGPRMVCTACGAIRADARPNWNERAPPSLFGTNTY